MFRAFLILAALLFATPALAQPVQCADRPAADSSNACANTRFVQNHGGGGSSTLTTNHIFVGNGSNIATDVAMTGDCTIVAAGAITCTKSSGNTILGMAFQAPSAVSITGGTITGLPTPTLAPDAATKGYVDALVAAGRPQLAPVRVATVAALSNTPTYANGAAGVGATLTAGSVGILTVDGTATVLNDRILVKDQASQFQNGPYFVSTAGTAGVAYVLTRVTDADTAAELPNNLTMLVTAGATLIGSSWSLNQPAAITVGTTALPFIQTASQAVSYWSPNVNDIFNNNSGNVGIGTSTPTAKLSVVGFSDYTRAGKTMTFNPNNTAANVYGTISMDSTQNMGLSMSSSDTHPEYLYMKPTGQIGMGTQTPTAPLHVKGASNNIVSFETAAGQIGWEAYKVNGVDKGFLEWNINDTDNGVGTAMTLENAQGKLHLRDNSGGGITVTGGAVGVGTVAPISANGNPTKMQVIQGSGGAPIVVSSNAVQISRTEQLTNDTQGGDNAALDVRNDGHNTSGGGIIAQPVAIRALAAQYGSGDSVGLYSLAYNFGTGGYAAFGAFLVATATVAGGGAIALGLATDNSTGIAQPFHPSGSVLFVGVDSPCSGNAGCSAAYLARNSGQSWDVGYSVQNGSVSTAAFISPGFKVDPSGNETALTNTATSDERLKDIHGPFNRGLAEILQINPILYNWKAYPDKSPLGGVSAQDVQRVIPEAVSEIDAEGHLGVSDRPLVAALINSVHELKSANDNLRACQSSWRCRLFGP